MTSPLDSFNSHGIRVVADRGPDRPEARAAFLRHTRGVAELIEQLKQSDLEKAAAATTAKRAK
jgi:hypothetical protein